MLNYFLWVCDYLRVTLTVAIVSFVLFADLRAAGARRAILPLAATVAAAIIVSGAAGLGTRRRRLKRLWNELQPLEDFSSPPQKIDSRDFFLGGLCYCNADNPALFVPGPLVYAINFANKTSYLYSAYVAGFVLLGMWCISEMRRSCSIIDARRRPTTCRPSIALWRCVARSRGAIEIDKLHALEMKGKLQLGAARLDTTLIAAAPLPRDSNDQVAGGVTITLVDERHARKKSPGEPVEELTGLWLDEARLISPFVRLRDWRETAKAVRVAGKDRLGNQVAWIVRLSLSLSRR